ncbi:MAG: hypothetical protein OXM59_09185 [Gammaproteobacteria bacterium]|nr:hypothetical protein [Gammaproteobacteria bacterium]
MKKLEQFSLEEIGEEWLRELYKVVARRRGVMFRLIDQSARMLLLGNAGGAALVIGFMSTSPNSEDAAYHWVALTALVIFAVGILTSAITTILVALVSVKEAHGAETALKKFVDGEMDRTQVLFFVENQAFRVADFATASGVAAGTAFLIGGIVSIVLLMLFF